jgi:hypothetical protein
MSNINTHDLELLEGFVGNKAMVIGKHPHSGETVDCDELKQLAKGLCGLRVINDKLESFYVFKPKQLICL